MKVQQNISFFPLLSFAILFSIWIILSGYFETFFIFCGIFSSVFTLLLFKRLVNLERAFYKIKNDSYRISFYYFISYMSWLVYQITLSSVYVVKKIVLFQSKAEYLLIVRECVDHNDVTITLFSNSVTITPGTLTINVKKKKQSYLFFICLIDKDLERGIPEMESKIIRMLS